MGVPAVKGQAWDAEGTEGTLAQEAACTKAKG